MTDKKETGYNGWIKSNSDKLWPLVPGLYWVVFKGDSESTDGYTLYEFDDYTGLFNIQGHDEETGVPYGSEYMSGGCDWNDVVAYHEQMVIEPKVYEG